MPNNRNAEKALRQSQKRRLQNRQQRTTLRNAVKKVRTAATGADAEAAQTAFRDAAKKLDKAAAKKLIHKNAAARTKSRLSRLLKSQKASAK